MPCGWQWLTAYPAVPPRISPAGFGWMPLPVKGDAEGRFLRRLHGSFCDTLADEYFGASSTFASAVVGADGLCRICNVGDSRVYHISAEGRWRQVSHDHTVLADLIEQGEARADTEYADMYYALAHCLIADDEETHFKIFTDS